MVRRCHLCAPQGEKRVSQHKKEERLSDYSDVAWQAVLRESALAVTAEASERIKKIIGGLEERDLFVEVVRLPRQIIGEAVHFESKHASCCLRSKQELPSRPLPDPWSQARKKGLRKEVLECIERVLKQAVHYGLILEDHVSFSRSSASLELFGEIEKEWDDGERNYYGAFQEVGEAAKSADVPANMPSAPVHKKKRRRKRGKSIEARLAELMRTVEGRERLLAAGNSKEIGRIVDRCGSAVRNSEVWKVKVKPLLEMNKAYAKLARYENEERRQDRQK